MNIDVTRHDTSLTKDIEILSKIREVRIGIISDAAPERNGVGSYYVDLLEHLRSRLATVEMFCPTIDENGKWRGGLVLPLPGDATQKLCLPNPFAMQRFLKRVNPDVVVIATPGAYGLVGAFLASRLRIPAIAGFHTSFQQLTDLYWKDSLAGKIVHGYFKVSNNYLFRKCQLVFANSEDMIEQARQLNPRKVQLISTIISPLFTLRSPVAYHGRFKRILFAGRLAPEKNIETIIRSAQALPDIDFSIAGEGPLHEQVMEATRQLPNVSYLGWLEREALCEQIDQHDALVLPSFFESFGTIALEAMARQRLVVVSEGCGIAHWPELRKGLYVMEGEELLPSLLEIKNLSDAQRQERANIAKQLTQAINEKNLNDWYQIILENCRQA